MTDRMLFTHNQCYKKKKKNCMILLFFPREYKHDFCFAGLLTYSVCFAFPPSKNTLGQWQGE